MAMPPDPERKYQSLIHLCQAVHSSPDRRTLFRQAAAAIHELTGCDRVGLTLAPGDPSGQPGFLVEFAGSPHGTEVPAPREAPPAVQWIFEHYQDPHHSFDGGRNLPGSGSAPGHYLPLVYRGEVLGILEIAGREEDQAGQWDRKFLEELAGLLALGLGGLAAHARVAELERFRRETAYLRDEIKTDRDLRPLTGESRAMKAVRLAVRQVAPTESTVLILGETGTGKELVARAIHQLSPRRDRLLVAVNCAALAPGVIASELFGHEQGAFTGATKRRLGRFELAHQGTLFLDEVGELPPDTQVMLLRVLQERVIERVGGQGPVPVDVRVIAATHQDLTAALGAGRFRADLFFRLNVFPITVPPLRERREDIPDLVRHFLRHFGRRLNKPAVRVSAATLQQLQDYPWPGNVRELENLMERALIVTTGDALEVDPNWLKATPVAGTVAGPRAGLVELERGAILDALARCHGKIYGPGGAAAALGLKPTTLYGKMRKHGIPKRPASE
jgi:formate hydrogenlyase transcriptional activator